MSHECYFEITYFVLVISKLRLIIYKLFCNNYLIIIMRLQVTRRQARDIIIIIIKQIQIEERSSLLISLNRHICFRLVGWPLAIAKCQSWEVISSESNKKKYYLPYVRSL